MEEEQAPLVLSGTRPPILWRAAGLSLTFVAAGVWLIRRGEAGGWLALGFFGLCALLVLLVPLATRHHLRLDPDRFTVTTPILTRTYRWAEVDRFFAVGDATSGAVAFDLAAASPRRRGRGQRLTRRLFGYDDALPQTYGMPPEDLAELLNRWKAARPGRPWPPTPTGWWSTRSGSGVGCPTAARRRWVGTTWSRSRSARPPRVPGRRMCSSC